LRIEERYARTVKGGMGAAKTGGNYAASFKATTEAAKDGFDQVIWLDGREHRYVEEAGAMNVMFVNDGKLYTSTLGDTILPGITRDSILTLAGDMEIEVVEAPILLSELISWSKAGTLTEAFGTGTAAVISPIGEMVYGDTSIVPGDGSMGPVAKMMYDTLTGIQFGTVEDTKNWTRKVRRFT
jgi:branched-chain amino acid aminotransferase